MKMEKKIVTADGHVEDRCQLSSFTEKPRRGKSKYWEMEIKRLISTADMVKLINFYFVFHLINFFVD
jgi:hypothetical protein